MKKRSWVWYILLGIPLLVLLIAGTGYGLGMLEKPELKKARLSASVAGEVPLGSPVNLHLEVTLPMDVPPPECRVEAPSGTVAGRIQIRQGRYLWKHRLWDIHGVLHAVKPGAATGGKVVVSLKGRVPAEETFMIPDFVIAPIKAEGESLDLAGPLTEKGDAAPRWYWVIAGFAVLLLAVWWFWLRRRSRLEKGLEPLPPWVRAELALDRLAMDVAEQKTPLGMAFLRLTDLVRKYLEERYRLPVTTRTTDEFMAEMRDSSPLPETDQPFLREFLAAADLVKFARMPPDEKGLQHALNGARELVKHTIPAPQKEGGDHV